MKYPRSLGTVVLVAVVMLAGGAFLARAQTDSGGPPPAAVLLDDSDMEQLVAPIALYPDPLLAQVLPAATYPDEIQSAANWLQANSNPSEDAINAQTFEPPIKALIHYPSVLTMMSSQMDWTQQLGIAVINQQPDVMSAIQRLRARAQSDGALVSGPQQQVVTDDDGIEIIPADDNVVYVPQYDPDAVYIGDNGISAAVTFDVGYPAGIWLDNSFDWHDHWVGVGGGWNHGWAHPVGGKRPEINQWQRDRARPIPVQAPRAGNEGWRNVRPGYEDPRDARPSPNVFNGYQKPADVKRNVDRAQQSHVAPAPAPRPAPQENRSPPPVFHAQGNGKTVAAQSDRGHASVGASGGGAKSGGRGK